MTSECPDEICITCSDIAMPVRVLELLPDGLAVAETEAGPEVISVALVEVRTGDIVLVHAKEAIAVQGGSFESPEAAVARGDVSKGELSANPQERNE